MRICEACHCQISEETGHHFHATKCVELEMKWIIGQFRAIREYTHDAAIAKACADAEDKLSHYA